MDVSVCHELFREALGALSRLGEVLVDVDACLGSDGLRLGVIWHQLKVAIDLGHLQHERASVWAEASLATLREASA